MLSGVIVWGIAVEGAEVELEVEVDEVEFVDERIRFDALMTYQMGQKGILPIEYGLRTRTARSHRCRGLKFSLILLDRSCSVASSVVIH